MTESQTSLISRIHSEALNLASRYQSVEADLLEVLQKVERHRVFVAKGYSSLFRYVVNELGLSESVAYNLITVARKSREVPALKTEIEAGAITLSNARKIAAVLTPENQTEWIEKARTLTHRELEREVVKIRPEAATREKATYVSESRVKLELGLSADEMMRLRRVQDLLSQSRRRAVSLEEVLGELVGDYLKRADPIERAKRVTLRPRVPARPPTQRKESAVAEPLRKSAHSPVGRVPIPASVAHAVNLRDGRRCGFRNENGEKCDQARWIEIHHVVPVSEGGRHEVENLETLCSVHHRLKHESIGQRLFSVGHGSRIVKQSRPESL